MRVCNWSVRKDRTCGGGRASSNGESRDWVSGHVRQPTALNPETTPQSHPISNPLLPCLIPLCRFDIHARDAPFAGEKFVQGDLADLELLTESMSGCEVRKRNLINHIYADIHQSCNTISEYHQHKETALSNSTAAT